MIEQLINTGVRVIGSARHGVGKPVVIVGPARSGTSMIAGALYHLGMFMGKNAVSPVYEDMHLSAVFESGDDGRTRKIIKAYVKEYGCFGWKRPSSIDQLDRVDKIFEKPNYVFVFKDVFAIANRNNISMSSDVVSSMDAAVRQFANAIEFIKTARPNALLVSYEKAMLYREQFVGQLADFCGLRIGEEKLARAVDFIEAVPEEYLEKSRINRTHGRLMGVDSDGALFGWARFAYQREKMAIVDILVNESIVASVNAIEEIHDPQRKVNGMYGFYLPLLEDGCVKAGDVVRARVQGDIRDLDDSPLVIR